MIRDFFLFTSNFDSSVQRVKYWTSASSGNSSPGYALTPSSSNAHLVGLGISMAMSGAPNALSESLSTSTGIPNLSTGQRKRIKSYLKRCRLNPRHTQLNLEGYLLLPVQRIPRYKLLVRFNVFFWVFELTLFCSWKNLSEARRHHYTSTLMILLTVPYRKLPLWQVT